MQQNLIIAQRSDYELGEPEASWRARAIGELARGARMHGWRAMRMRIARSAATASARADSDFGSMFGSVLVDQEGI